jgi:hypothetical protein
MHKLIQIGRLVEYRCNHKNYSSRVTLNYKYNSKEYGMIFYDDFVDILEVSKNKKLHITREDFSARWLVGTILTHSGIYNTLTEILKRKVFDKITSKSLYHINTHLHSKYTDQELKIRLEKYLLLR